MIAAAIAAAVGAVLLVAIGAAWHVSILRLRLNRVDILASVNTAVTELADIRKRLEALETAHRQEGYAKLGRRQA